MFYSEPACSLEDFAPIVTRTLEVEDAPNALSIVKNIPIYESANLRELATKDRAAVLSELANILLDGAGVFVMKGAFTDTSVVDDASSVFDKIIEDERETISGGDHFAAKGANDRIWNALEKLCIEAPDVFARYYANDMIAMAAEAWLGPNYQVTSQINVVRPGGQAQQAHRDYHLGFQSTAEAGRYPAHMHHLSPGLTLQGAVAHCDMPLETGPTKLLPFSQTYQPGYMAWRREDFVSYFEDNCVQLPLEKGDAVFFNPALFHAAGSNLTTNASRMANLVQISSAFGRAMETVDRRRMSKSVFNALVTSNLGSDEIANAIASTAEGYSFPTNLDRDPPIGGLAPKSQQQILAEAVAARWSSDKLNDELDALFERQSTH
ncbi:phytanoyl-CoA dioxygenase family protein [Maritalea sp.]|uniref:phytanoyl-CoA dioxygenase family protein n=1 Tax=Maritalea sp. TaxID=2003361 RepID=UPI003EFAE65B